MVTDVRLARECGDDDVVAGRGPGQRGWYEWAAQWARGASVLDAGCGLGYGLEMLERVSPDVRGQDMDPRLRSDRVHIGPLSDVPSKSVDLVISIDVIEHVEDDGGFVAELARIARARVVMSTPNWTAGRCIWPYHVREYTPSQLRSLCEPFGKTRMWKGTPDGFERYEISHRMANDVFNAARVNLLTSVPARALNAIVPRRARIHSHLAVVIDVTSH
jgi:SAM-dependent methyltransferase